MFDHLDHARRALVAIAEAASTGSPDPLRGATDDGLRAVRRLVVNELEARTMPLEVTPDGEPLVDLLTERLGDRGKARRLVMLIDEWTDVAGMLGKDPDVAHFAGEHGVSQPTINRRLRDLRDATGERRPTRLGNALRNADGTGPLGEIRVRWRENA